MTRRPVATSVAAICGLLLAALVTGTSPRDAAVSATAAAAAKYDWLQFGFTEDKRANDTAETAISTSTVSRLHPLFRTALADAPDGAPVYLSNVTTAGGVRDLVFAQGEHGHLMAFDARTGASVWTDFFGPGGISNSAPAIDPNRQFIYIDANDGFVHKVGVGDGTEVRGGGWPEPAGPGKSSSQLTIATAKNGHSYLYASNQGHGHVTTIDLGTGSQHVFSLACASTPDVHFGLGGQPGTCAVRGANPWSRSPSFDPSLDLLFQMGGTNNGPSFVPGHIYRQSWVALAADGSTHVTAAGGFPVDSYTPSDWAATVKSDRDIGSGGLLILPVGLSSKFPHLGVQPGKDRRIRLLNLANLSGQGGPGHVGGELQLFNFPQMSMMRSQGAVWTNPADHSVWVFVPGQNGIAGFTVNVDAAGNPSLNLHWTVFNGWTTSAVVANGVLFAATGGGEHTPTQPNHILQAFDPTTGHTLWTGAIGLHHWSSPIVANGVVYMPDGNSGGFGSGTTGDLLAWSLA
jgi:outer membrane protein assembly factor BamB